MSSACWRERLSTWRRWRTSSTTERMQRSPGFTWTESRRTPRCPGSGKETPTSSAPSSAPSMAAGEVESDDRYPLTIDHTMSDRIHNFSAGPAVLPEPVLRKAQEAIWNVAGSGIGIMEHSHRGKVFDMILAEAEATCRALADIPDDYAVLFLQGGASLQYSMVPMNFLPADRTGDYLNTGVWSQKAIKEAKFLGRQVHVAASSEATNFDRIPRADEIKYSANPAYVHLTTNNTIYGTQWKTEPAVPQGVP